MAREKKKIKCISYCYVGDELVCTDDLNEEQKERLAVGLQVTWMNELFRGKAVFSPPPGFEVGRNEKGLITCKRIPIEPGATKGVLSDSSVYCPASSC